MLGKLIGAVVGGKMAEQTKDISGPAGAAIGAAVPFIISRMSIPAMIAMGVGGYAVKRYMDRKEPTTPQTPATATHSTPSTPATLSQPVAA